METDCCGLCFFLHGHLGILQAPQINFIFHSVGRLALFAGSIHSCALSPLVNIGFTHETWWSLAKPGRPRRRMCLEDSGTGQLWGDLREFSAGLRGIQKKWPRCSMEYQKTSMNGPYFRGKSKVHHLSPGLEHLGTSKVEIREGWSQLDTPWVFWDPWYLKPPPRM